MARRGAFSSTGSLDPFGGARGGLGRYNITGESITSLASYETYAVSVAWANGNASDEQYLAQLQKMVDLALPGTREFVTASNTLRDAQYSIGRNELVRATNNATTHIDRTAALTALLAYDNASLGTMASTDSQAYRDRLGRVASLRGDLRKERYTALLERVNNGKATTTQLKELASQLYSEASTAHDPDLDEWGQTVDQLVQRVKDEGVAQKHQDYQHHRITGAELLTTIDAQLAEQTAGSPAFLELTRQREDLATQVKNETSDKAEADVQAKRTAGKINDAEFLVYLRDSYTSADPGTAEWIRAGSRLAEYTYSLAEDKIRFDVSKGTRPVSDLIHFYENYLKGMNPGSEKYRSIAGAIISLQGRRGGGGALLLAGIGPIIDGAGALADIAGSKPPPHFTDLFHIDPTSAATFRWWENNRNSMIAAFSDGRATWTYIDQNGDRYELPFHSGMMSEVDNLHMTYLQVGLANSTTLAEAQSWVGRVVSGTNALQSRGAQYSMTAFQKSWDEIERTKQQLLAGGHLAEYINTVQAQAQMGELMRDKNPYISFDQRDRINTLLTGIGPRVEDPSLPNFGVGDPVLPRLYDGTIRVQWAPTGAYDADGKAIMAAAAAQIDPERGYLTQGAYGVMELKPVVDYTTDPDTNKQIPAYYGTHVAVQVESPLGGTVTVYQPLQRPGDVKGGIATPNGSLAGLQLPVYQTAGGPSQGVNITTLGWPTRVADTAGKGAVMPVFSIVTHERVNGVMTDITWFSLTDPTKNPEGGVWTRMPSAGGVLPSIILPTNVTRGGAGQWQIDGKDVSFDQLLSVARFWDGSDTGAVNTRGGGVEAGQGLHYETRTSGPNGLDLRPTAVIAMEIGERKSAESDVIAKPGRDPEAARLRLTTPTLDTRSERIRTRASSNAMIEYAGRSRDRDLLPIALRPVPTLAPRFGLDPVELKPKVIPPIRPVAQTQLKTAPAPALKPIIIPKGADPKYANPMNANPPIAPIVLPGGGQGSKAL